MPGSSKALYESDWVAVYALLVLPVLFLGRLALRRFAHGPGVEPYAARFVGVWTIVFALASIVDPIATGLLGVPLLPFVLLGDYRVFALVLPVMEPGRPRASVLAEAVAWTLPVPLIAYGAVTLLTRLRGALPPQTLWIVYECAFAALALFMMVRVVPQRVGVERAPVRRYVRAVLAFVVGYYVLWAASDALIIAGVDAAWGLRVLPNLLYYGAFVPFAYWRFFGRL